MARRRIRSLALGAAFIFGDLLHASAPVLPIWIEESHAGSFYFLAQTLPLNEPHTLVLFDAHSDASAIANSDAIREAIRKVPSVEDRALRLQRWREQGAIQCFNWIEPLMPAPISEVVWVSARRLTPEERTKQEQDAREYLDAHEEALPRDAGSLAPRFRMLDFEQWLAESATWTEQRPFVASIDLDYFAALPDHQLASEVHEVVSSVLNRRGLQALCWALSTPWLKSLDQADKLLHAALDESWRISNAELRWEPFAVTGPDRSMLAKLRQRRGEQIPAFDLSNASIDLRTKVLQHWQPKHTLDARERMESLLSIWRSDSFLPSISILDRPREGDGTYRLEASERAKIVMAPPPTGARVRWWALKADAAVYRVSDVDFGFASAAPRWIQQKTVRLAEGTTESSLDFDSVLPVLDAQHRCGTTQVFAEVIRDGESRFSNILTLRVKAAGTAGLQAAWSEQFALPYVFGSTWFRNGQQSGPETGWGADCANFLIAGFRSEGWRIPWGSPRDLRQWLEPIPNPTSPRSGCIVDFGSHVAAVWEDREPVGHLNDNDLVVHQLEGVACILPFSELKKGRPAPKLMGLRNTPRTLSMIFGGDVMLGRKVGERLRNGDNPMEALSVRLRHADLAVVNLEGPLLPPHVERDSQALFAAPSTAAEMLKTMGVDAVTLANNHSMDRGKPGLRDTLSVLDAAGLRHCGTGASSREALQPLYLEAKGRRVALFSFYDGLVRSSLPDHGPTIASSPANQEMKTAIALARTKADWVVILPHWGQEHSQVPQPDQRAQAAAWLDAGADLIVGSGPHVVQPLDHHFDGSVAWSLGNLVFDGPGPHQEWSRGALLEVTWDLDTRRMIRSRLLPVQISDEGSAKLLGVP